MTVQDVLWALDQAFPFALAEEWDNVGLLLGDARREVSGCVVALDATEEALDFARARGANLLVTHHPVLFRARKRLVEDDVEARFLCRAIREGVSLIAAHTNFDNAPVGMNDCLATALGLNNVLSLEGGLRVGKAEACDWARRTEECLRAPVRLYGSPLGMRVAVCGGAGGEFWKIALAAGADVYVTGEIRYHEALEAMQSGLCVLEAGHGPTERVGLAALAQKIPGPVAIFDRAAG